MDRNHKTAAVFASQNIRRYVESHGEYLPNDWQAFKKGNTYENHCVFCTRIVDNLERRTVFFHNRDQHNSIVTTESGTIMCDNCFTTVKAGFVHENTKSTEMTGSLLRYIAEKRINADSVHYRFTWRNSTLFYNNGDINHCIFCNNEINKGTAVIYIPVKSYRENRNLHGGKVRVCNSCKEQLNKKLDFSKGLFVPELYPKGCKICKCSNCLEKYVIEAGEVDDRNASLLTADEHWMCPDCSVSIQLYSSNNSPRFIERGNNSMVDNIPRKIKKLCEFCIGEFHVDATYSNKIISRYIHSTKHKICNKCFSLKDRLLTPSHTRILHINSYILVLLEKDSTEWTYTVIDTAVSEEEQEKEFGHTKSLYLPEVISIVLDFVYKNYSSGKLL